MQFPSVTATLCVAFLSVSALADERTPDRVLASVRIGRGGGCSGTILAKGKRHAFGISAAHCTSQVGKQFTFGNPDGTTGRARWIAIDRGNDLSLFICWANDVLAACPVPRQSPDWSQRIEAVGYPGGKGPKWKRYTYRGAHDVQSSNGRFHRYCFKNEGPGRFTGGDSGGGVFCHGDWLVAVSTHDGPHAATHKQIVEFLTTNRGLMKGVSPFGGPANSRVAGGKHAGWRPSPNIPIKTGNGEPRQRMATTDRTTDGGPGKIRALKRQVDALKRQIAGLKSGGRISRQAGGIKSAVMRKPRQRVAGSNSRPAEQTGDSRWIRANP